MRVPGVSQGTAARVAGILAPLVLSLVLSPVASAEGGRPFTGDDDARFWLRNMLGDHRYTLAEAGTATGLEPAAVQQLVERLKVDVSPPGPRPAGTPLRILPYPGGRHPRRGFFDGAVDPQRETKLSVFTPWDPAAYAVVDLPEAIWSDLGLTYLAHRHIDTLWDRQGIRLPRLEWQRGEDGSLSLERTLPNGVVFGAGAVPGPDEVALRWWIRNGSGKPLTNLRAQVCVLLGRVGGMDDQSRTNKVLSAPFAAVRDRSGDRWVITAWRSLDRVWENPPVPCIHSDPRLDDCPPGETRSAAGWLWFREGGSLDGHLDALRRRYGL